LGRGDYEAAYRHLTALGAPGDFPAHDPTALEGVMDLVEAAVRTGRHAAARAHVHAAHRLGSTGVCARIAFLIAGAAALAATRDTAGGLFETALAMAGPARTPFDRARVQLAHGQHLRRTRRPTDATRHLGEALEVFDALGAQPWCDRARSELDATGRVPRSRTVGGTAALTSQEREIAMLAASGLTNRQIGQRLFLSHRTVGAHLYRIFPKLAVTSRAGLRDALTTGADA
jgi:DNA-binding CsgD family transcriptional regulator